MTVEEFTSRMMSNLDGEKDAEIERLRKALEEIVRANPVSGRLEVPQTKIARAALVGQMKDH